MLEELRAAVTVETVDPQPPRLECADAAGDDDRLGEEARAGRGRDIEAAIVARVQRADLLLEMKSGVERLDLLGEPLGELAPGAERQPGDVVDGLVGVELDALAADARKRVDGVRADLPQAELEDLEQADRAGADDDGIGLDRLGRGERAGRHGRRR